MTSTAKRTEKIVYSGAFVVFCCNSAIFRAFCLEVKINFVYLQTVKWIATIEI